MDGRTKRSLIVVCLLVLVGTVATVATGQQYAQLSGPAAPTVISIAAVIDGVGKVRVFRAWDDGYTEYAKKLNGSEEYTAWQPIIDEG